MARRRHHHDEAPADEPSGRPVRHAYQADPSAVAPCVSARYWDLLTSGRPRTAMGTGDARPPIARPGTQPWAEHPSRRGDRLYYADGRVTDLAGQPVQAEPVPRCVVHTTEIHRARQDRARRQT